MLRTHNRVTYRSAELIRVHVFDAAVRCGGNDGDVHYRQERNQAEESNCSCPRRDRDILNASTPLRASPNTDRYRGEPTQKEGWKNEEHDDAVVRIGETLERQRNENYCRCRDDNGTGRCNPITEDVRDERLKNSLHAQKLEMILQRRCYYVSTIRRLIRAKKYISGGSRIAHNKTWIKHAR